MQVDDALGLGREVRQAGSAPVAGSRAWPSSRSSDPRRQQRAERRGADAVARRPKKWRRVSADRVRDRCSSTGPSIAHSLRDRLVAGSASCWPPSSTRPARAGVERRVARRLADRAAACAAACGSRGNAASCPVEQLAQHASFSPRRRRARSPAGSASAIALVVVAPAFEQRPLGQLAGGFDVRRIVQQHQRLQRRVGPAAAHGAGLAVGRVEGRQRRRRHGPLPERVHAAAVEIRRRGSARTSAPEKPRRTPSLPTARRLIRLDARPADLVVEQAARRPARCRGSSRPAAGTAGRARAGGSPDPSRAASGVTCDDCR